MILLRAGTLWMFFPIFGQAAIPAMVRLSGAVTLSVALLPTVGASLPPWNLVHPPSSYEMIAFATREMLIGAGMALTARWIFSSVVASAHWIGMQMGFSAGSVIDPERGSTDSSWAELQQFSAIILFFGIGGHLFLIQAIADSYKFDFSDFAVRITDAKLGIQYWGEVGARFFAWMLRLSGPLVAVLLLLQAALGILSKFIPQINIWSVSIPITIGVGVIVFVLLSPLYGDALTTLFSVERETNYLWLKAMGAR
ncbi:MAG: flagellar biosynthetic protein FliR [Bdellovibrionales bacterium]|nr:flagellar biosynthetic protein FliR [Bdellovibrionales bacterium]